MKIKIGKLVLYDSNYEKPKPVVENKCDHDWVAAGPTMYRDEILNEIDDPDFCWQECYKNEGRLNIKVCGQHVWREATHRMWAVHDYESWSWENKRIRGIVCLHCGECRDHIKTERDYWLDKIKKCKTKKEERRIRQALADKMWKDSECYED